MAERSPLVEQVLSGRNRPLAELAAQGMVPLPPEELVALQVELATGSDQEIAELAREALGSLDARLVAPVLEQANEAVVRYLATHSREADVLEAVLRRRDVPTDVLVELAPRLPANLQEVLLLRQDRIVANPEILDALAQNGELSTYSSRRIHEYRTHLLGGAAAAAEEGRRGEAHEAETESALDDPEVRAAVEEARKTPAEGEIEEETGLSENQIRQLAVPFRVKLARGASRTMRNLLIRDSNPLVAVAVIEANPIPDQEIEGIAKNRSVIEDVLERIARERRWVSKYPIMLALITNPRTPVGIGVKLVPRLSMRDLRNLTRDRNVPDAVRSTAVRLYRVKSK